MLKYTCPIVAWLLLLCVCAPVCAYCRESVAAPGAGACVRDPNATYLFWSRSCTTYVFNPNVFDGVRGGERVTRSAYDAAFQAWADVRCDDRKSFFVEQSLSVTQTDVAEFVYGKVNESVVMMLTPEQWASAEDHDPRAVALTLVWFSKRTGEIMDFDMQLNSGAGVFADCVAQPCVPGMLDLQNAVTHEAGHVLGLAHSSVPGATMQPSTTSAHGPETQKRVLEHDDKLGYCALHLPQFICEHPPCMCPAPPIYGSKPGAGCSCPLPGWAGWAGRPGWPGLQGHRGSDVPGAWALLVALYVWRRVRGRGDRGQGKDRTTGVRPTGLSG